MKLETDEHIWHGWAVRLHQWGIDEFAAWLLEATQPVNILGAQVLYIGQPLIEIFTPATQIQALASILENSERTKAFIAYLREANFK